jgi:hypothetical protein
MRPLRSIVAVPAALAALAVAGDIGHQDQAYAASSRSTSGSKPESKLWFNDGWWATLFSPATMRHDIFRLDPATQSWTDSGVATDPRSNTREDVLWDAGSGKLYVASHIYAATGAKATATAAARLYRYSYDAAAGRYALDPGFPATMNAAKSETLVLDRDSTGTLWATWTYRRRVYVNHSVGGNDAVWAAPYILPGADTALTKDDISSLIHFGGARIGVMWSDQTDHRFHFAVHEDGAPDGAWTSSVVPLGGLPADDHINLKADSGGTVYAAVKTSATGRRLPLVMLLARSPAGAWDAVPFGVVGESHTRPIVLLDEQHGVVHVFATCPQPPMRSGQAGGDVCEKALWMGSPFGPGIGATVIRDAGVPDMNDVTSTKQNLSSATGMVVLASNATTHTYWHATLPLG